MGDENRPENGIAVKGIGSPTLSCSAEIAS
jgi:hypothetical protein